MGSNAFDVDIAHCVEDAETTIEIKIKTLDSQTYSLRVNKCVPVPLLKEKIANVTGVLSEQQRLICRGKVLKDDELLSAYHVEDGHTLHLVVRQPGQSSAEGNMGHEAPTSNSTRNQGPSVARSIVFEAVNVDQGSSEFSSLGQILSSILGSIGMPPNVSSQVPGGPAPADTGSSGPIQSRIFPTSVRVELDSQQASLFPQNEAPVGSSQPNLIPDSLTTISQYVEFMSDAFRRQGFNATGRAEGNTDHGITSDSASRQHVLPNAASLAEAMQSTRQLLIEQAGECLSQLSRQLEDLVNVTDSAMRRNLQGTAMRSGTLLQNLGSLLLELGRTTMMLRLGQAPSEAVVNAGPAVFISPSGPNPLMVPPVPFFPGSSPVQMGTMFSGLGLLGEQPGSALNPRDIDVHVRTSRAVPVVSTNPSEQIGAQAQEHTAGTRSSSHANISEAVSSVMGSAPFTVESGVRVLPLRTVVAVPAAVSRSMSGSSSEAVGLLSPLLTRIQQMATANGSDAGSTQFPNEPSRSGIHVNQQQIPEPSLQAQNSINIGATESGSDPVNEAGNMGSTAVNIEDTSQTTAGQQNGLNPLSQLLNRLQRIGSLVSGEQARANGTSHQESMAGSAVHQVDARREGRTPEASGASDEGILFSNLVRQIMPYISQGAGVGQNGPVDGDSAPSLLATTESRNSSRSGLNESSSSHQHHRDPLEVPSPKRQRKE